MADVYEAELIGDLGFRRKVAIKRMLGDAAVDSDRARRFLDEARIASLLHHAGIVSVIDVGLLDGLPFQVLELVEGLDVQQLQQRAGGVLPLEVALIIASDVAHALDHAHLARDASGNPLGIVHRDVKPSNVLVSWNGDVKLTDFGIAFAHDRMARTEAGSVAGTHGFIAPEQRHRSEVDGRTDVFALGVTLHAMLTGKTPLSDVKVEIDVLSGKPMPLDAAIPDDVRAVIARAVDPERRDRVTADELADLLGALLAPRLSRDARGHLREYMARWRVVDKPKPGVLDQLLGLDVVLTCEQLGEEPRRYALRPTAIAPPPGDVDSESKPTVDGTPPRGVVRGDTPTPLGGPRERRGRARGAVVAVASLVAAGAVAVTTWQVQRTDERHDASATRMAPTERDAGPEVAVPPPIRTVDAGAGVASAGDMVVLDAGIVSTTRPERRRDGAKAGARGGARTEPKTDGRTDAHRGARDERGSLATGFVQVIGEQNIGAKVVIDGRDVGFAPNKLEVSQGRHQLVVVRKDGSRLESSIEVTDYHSVARPLRPTL